LIISASAYLYRLPDTTAAVLLASITDSDGKPVTGLSPHVFEVEHVIDAPTGGFTLSPLLISNFGEGTHPPLDRPNGFYTMTLRRDEDEGDHLYRGELLTVSVRVVPPGIPAVGVDPERVVKDQGHLAISISDPPYIY